MAGVKGLAKNGYTKKPSLCWKCQKACGGCSWSVDFVPVKGWYAEQDNIRSSEGQYDIESYRVIYCPEFEPDRKRQKQ